MKLNRKQLRVLIESLLNEQVDIPGIDKPWVNGLRMNLVKTGHSSKKNDHLKQAEAKLEPYKDNKTALNHIDSLFRQLRRDGGYYDQSEAGISALIRRQIYRIRDVPTDHADVEAWLRNKNYPALLALYIANK